MSADPSTLAVRVHGYGPRRAIALHGLFGDGTSFDSLHAGLDPAVWTIVAPDLRGFGRSASLGGPYTIETAARDALAVADRFGWDRFEAFGHSMGGKAALRLAILAPDRVTRIVGLAPIWAAPVPFDKAALARFRASADDVDKREAIIAGSTGGRLPGYWSRSVAAASFALSRREAYAAYLESFASDDVADAARSLDVPVLVIVGAHDAATLAMARGGWSTMRAARIVEFADCGHYPQLEAPLATAALIAADSLPSGGADHP